jgi:hypothetical protein
LKPRAVGSKVICGLGARGDRAASGSTIQSHHPTLVAAACRPPSRSGLLLAADRVHHLSGSNGASVSMSVQEPARKSLKRRFVVVRELKRHLSAYAGVIAFRELLRIPGVPIEIRRGSVILAGCSPARL